MNVNNNENLNKIAPTAEGVNSINAEWNTKKTYINSIYNFQGTNKLDTDYEYLSLQEALKELKTWFQNLGDKIDETFKQEIGVFIIQNEGRLKNYNKEHPVSLLNEAQYNVQLLDSNYKTRVLPEMQRFAKEALDHMVNNGGTLESFEFTGLPLGVAIKNVELIEDSSNPSNDTYTYNNGFGHVQRNVDFRQVKITFTYGRNTYTIQEGFSESPIDNTHRNFENDNFMKTPEKWEQN